MEKLAEILAEIWGREETTEWSKKPNAFLDNQTPMDFCQSKGYDELRKIFE